MIKMYVLNIPFAIYLAKKACVKTFLCSIKKIRLTNHIVALVSRYRWTLTGFISTNETKRTCF